MFGLVNEDERKLVQECGLFDSQWYLQQYPDVAVLGLDPLQHYLWFGASLGRDPGPNFSANAYLAKHPAVGKGVNPLVHYLRRFNRRVAIFAAYSNERVHAYHEIYLKALRKVCGTVIAVFDNHLPADEKAKIAGLADHCPSSEHLAQRASWISGVSASILG
ncbi:MAG TPA: hypothetical protein VIU14_03405 [Mesorhizobium sp.]